MDLASDYLPGSLTAMSSKRRLLLLTGIALAVGYSTVAADTLKCGGLSMPGYEQGAPVFLIDGAVWDRPVAEISEVEFASIQITCWHPESGRFSQSSPGFPAVILKTKTFVESPELMVAHDAQARKAMQELWNEATGGGETFKSDEGVGLTDGE